MTNKHDINECPECNQVMDEKNKWMEDNRPSTVEDWCIFEDMEDVENVAETLTNCLTYAEMMIDMHCNMYDSICESTIVEIFYNVMNIPLELFEEFGAADTEPSTTGIMYLCKYANEWYDFLPEDIDEKNLNQYKTHIFRKKLDKSLN